MPGLVARPLPGEFEVHLLLTLFSIYSNPVLSVGIAQVDGEGIVDIRNHPLGDHNP